MKIFAMVIVHFTYFQDEQGQCSVDPLLSGKSRWWKQAVQVTNLVQAVAGRLGLAISCRPLAIKLSLGDRIRQFRWPSSCRQAGSCRQFRWPTLSKQLQAGWGCWGQVQPVATAYSSSGDNIGWLRILVSWCSFYTVCRCFRLGRSKCHLKTGTFAKSARL